MPAGYSKKTLVEKLGIKEGSRVIFLNSPSHYDKILGKLPPNVMRQQRLQASLDFIHYFTKEKDELKKNFPKLKKALTQNGLLWISWRKGSSGITTDLNENIVREIGLKNDMVDVKVCAINEIWSGLKFVIRVKDRK